MATTVENANLVIYGWVRSRCNMSILIPVEIIKLCVSFYFTQMVFYKEKYGNGLEFNDAENIVEYTTPNPDTFYCRTCLFGIIISADDCDAFSITLKWTKTEYKKHKAMMMGWITKGKEGSIKDWDPYGLGSKNNAQYSCGINGGSGCLEFYLYKDFPSCAYRIMKNKTRMTHFPQEGDEFKLKFEFKNDKVEVYHNAVLMTDTSLDGVKEIMPALSLTYGGQKIQVIAWRFCKGDKTWS